MLDYHTEALIAEESYFVPLRALKSIYLGIHRICAHCHQPILTDVDIPAFGGICEECWDEIKVKHLHNPCCTECGVPMDEAPLYEIGGKLQCEDCIKGL